MNARWLLAHMASIILGMSFGLFSVSQAQGTGGGIGGSAGMSGAMPTVPGTEFGGVTDPSSIRIREGLRVIPSVQVSERYDTNVFLLPKSQLQGLDPGDFVTMVAPQLRGLYITHDNLVKVNAVVGAVGSYYTKNTELSYVGADAGAVVDMSNLLSQWRPGARWTVSNSFFYTPQPPAFLVGGQLGEQANPLVAGFQAYRTKTSSNSTNTIFELPLNRTLKLSGSYTYSYIRYGASQVQGTSFLINQDLHTYTAGLLKELSLYDTARVDFTGNDFDLGARGTFSARGGTIGWTHRFSSTVSLSAAGGIQVLAGEFNGVPLPSTIAPVSSLAFAWKNPATLITFAYRSGVTASLQFQGAAMLNHMVSCNITQNTPIRDLVGLLGVNYGAANEYGSDSGNDLSWTTVGGTAGFRYRATQKTFLTLTYTYQNVDNVLGGTHFAFERHVAELRLANAFY